MARSTSKPSRPDIAPARERILESAFKLFAEVGYDGTTTKDIAADAGVNEVTIFRSFGTKESLFHAAIIELSPIRTIMSVVDFDIQTSFEDMMVRNAEAVLGVMKENRHFFMMLVGEIWRHPEMKERIHLELLSGAISFIAAQMQRMMDEGRVRKMDPSILARSWMGMVQSYYLFTYLVGPGEPDLSEERKILRGFADIFVNGVGTRGDAQ